MPDESLVRQKDMGNSDIMIMDRGIADAGAADEDALPGLRSGLLNRRSFLFGSAVSLGALGLAGCASSDDLLRAEAAKTYGPATTRNSRSRRSMSARSIRNIFASSCATTAMKRPVRLSSIPAISIFIASKATETPPAMAPMSVARVPVERSSLCRAQGRMAHLDAAQGDDPTRARGGGIAPRHAGRSRQSAGGRTLYLYQNGKYTLYTIYSTSDPDSIGTGVTSGCTGLLESGHDRPLFPNARQDESGHAAGVVLRVHDTHCDNIERPNGGLGICGGRNYWEVHTMSTHEFRRRSDGRRTTTANEARPIAGQTSTLTNVDLARRRVPTRPRGSCWCRIETTPGCPRACG